MAEEKAMVTMMQQMKTNSQALQQKNLKLTHAHRVIPGHLPVVDQSKWDGKLAKRVVDLGVDTWEEICITVNVLRLERKRRLFTSKPVHLGMMTDIQVWIVSCVSFGQDVHWSNCKSVMVSLWGFEGMICKFGVHSSVLCSNFLSLLAEVCRIYVS